LKVVAADSGAALLNAKFEPLQIIATATVLVEPPYREASQFLAEPAFAPVEDGHALIARELELCQKLLEKAKADVVHLDISFGGILVEEISPIQLRGKARKRVLKILPRLRKLATGIKRVYGIEVLAIGKESIPVRIAELTTGAHAVLYACRSAAEEKKEHVLGLPSKCSALFTNGRVSLHSLVPAEHDIVGYALDKERLVERTRVVEMLNPRARGFRVLRIAPRLSKYM